MLFVQIKITTIFEECRIDLLGVQVSIWNQFTFLYNNIIYYKFLYNNNLFVQYKLVICPTFVQRFQPLITMENTLSLTQGSSTMHFPLMSFYETFLLRQIYKWDIRNIWKPSTFYMKRLFECRNHDMGFYLYIHWFESKITYDNFSK